MRMCQCRIIKQRKKIKIILHVDDHMSSLKTLINMIRKKKSYDMIDYHISIFL